MIEILLLPTGMKNKAIGMGLGVAFLLMVSDFAFLILSVASAAKSNEMFCWMFLPPNKELSVDQVIEILLLATGMKNTSTGMGLEVAFLVLEADFAFLVLPVATVA